MKLLDKFGNIITEINFGEVFVGEKTRYECYLYNDSGTDMHDIVINFEAVNPDLTEEQAKELLKEVELIKFPTFLGMEGKDIVIIEWTPALKIKKGLRLKVIIKGIEKYKP